MARQFARAIRPAVAAVLWLMLVAQALSRMTFSNPDPGFWAKHATGIADATVVGFNQRQLSKKGSLEESYQGPATWVLTLQVHKTLGDYILDKAAPDSMVVSRRYRHEPHRSDFHRRRRC